MIWCAFWSSIRLASTSTRFILNSTKLSGGRWTNFGRLELVLDIEFLLQPRESSMHIHASEAISVCKMFRYTIQVSGLSPALASDAYVCCFKEEKHTKKSKKKLCISWKYKHAYTPSTAARNRVLPSKSNRYVLVCYNDRRCFCSMPCTMKTIVNL